jgi:sugar lactone lactonase YvrE
MITQNRIKEQLSGLQFPEGPRWRDGALWFSDMRERTVNVFTPGAGRQVLLTLDDTPSGLGFMPDGSVLIVSMMKRRLMRLRDGKLDLHADLADFPGDFLNDMVVDDVGRAYVGSRSRQLSPAIHYSAPGGPDCVIAVEPDGRASIAADGLCAPNGTVISPDGRTLVIGETYARRVSVFERDAAGRLSARRDFARFDRTLPDGICLDAAGAVWVASPYSDACVRVLDGGEVTHRLAIPGAVACMLGGEGRRTLFVLAVDTRLRPAAEPGLAGPPATGSEPAGAIYSVDVDTPGAGLP